MRRIRVPLPSPSTAVACLALVVALGGTSYAVVALPANSVGTKQLKRNAVTSAKVKNASLLARDFKAGQLPRGPAGARGPAGPTGPAGPAGAPGATNVTVHSATGSGTAAVSCPAGQRATGGGGTMLAGAGSAGFLVNSAPEPATGTPTGWIAASDIGTDSVQAYVICAAP
jgi:hypothetical protein